MDPATVAGGPGPPVGPPPAPQPLGGLRDAVDRGIVAVNYGYEAVRDFFRSADVGRETVVVKEPEPLGTGGALKNLAGHVRGPFAAFNGDVIDAIDLAALLRVHR